MVSQFLYRATPIAMTAAMAAITSPIGPVITVMAVPIAGASVMIVPARDITLPTTSRSGPIAATTSPILAIISLCSSDKLLNQSTAFWIASATFEIVGAKASPRDVAATSMELLSFSMDPPKPPIIASAISAVVPSSASAPERAETSPGAVLISASQFDI